MKVSNALLSVIRTHRALFHSQSLQIRNEASLKLFRLSQCAAISLLIICNVMPVHAEEAPQVLDDITVEGVYEQAQPFELNQSISAIGIEAIEQQQASNIMELLETIPGVTIEGGPRANGMNINIRGFSSNEDILVRIDGAAQNFEKYRFGLGLSIDPELLKQVTVSRGAAILTRGSGKLGGVVDLETIDARDLLAPSEKWGMKLKYGHRTNNDSNNVTITGLARPTDNLDILLSAVKRDSNDFTLPDGSKYPDSEETQLSGLAKIEWFTDQSETSFAYRFSDEAGREPFDATVGLAGIGNTVFRISEENSYTINSRINPDSDWLKIQASLGFTDKNITDEDSLIASGTDVFQYDIWTAELTNEINHRLFGQQNYLTIGTQFNREQRDVTRINPLQTVSNPSQPSGAKTNYGIYASNEILLGDFSIGGTLRADHYQIDSADEVKTLLKLQNRDPSIEFNQVSPGFTLNYDPTSLPITLFYNYAELFRAPLIDEYFRVPPFGRCGTFSEFNSLPPPPNLADFGADIAGFLAALAAYDALVAAQVSDPFSDQYAVCGDSYQPEESKNHELGITLSLDDFIVDGDMLSAKLTYFYADIENTLESLYQNTVTGETSQPGTEVHYGYEFDLNYDTGYHFSRLAISTLDGYQSLNYFENNSDPTVNLGDPSQSNKQELINNAPDKLTFTFGKRFQSIDAELGYRLNANASRKLTVGTKPIAGCSFFIPSCNIIGEQSGFTTHDIFASWAIQDLTILRLNIDNVTNKRYRLSGFGGAVGDIAPGIDIRLTVSHQF